MIRSLSFHARSQWHLVQVSWRAVRSWARPAKAPMATRDLAAGQVANTACTCSRHVHCSATGASTVESVLRGDPHNHPRGTQGASHRAHMGISPYMSALLRATPAFDARRGQVPVMVKTAWAAPTQR